MTCWRKQYKRRRQFDAVNVINMTIGWRIGFTSLRFCFSKLFFSYWMVVDLTNPLPFQVVHPTDFLLYWKHRLQPEEHPPDQRVVDHWTRPRCFDDCLHSVVGEKTWSTAYVSRETNLIQSFQKKRTWFTSVGIWIVPCHSDITESLGLSFFYWVWSSSEWKFVNRIVEDEVAS